MGVTATTALKAVDSLAKLGAGGFVFVLLAAGGLGGGYLLIDRVIEREDVIVDRLHDLDLRFVDLAAAIRENTERADARFDDWMEAQERRHAESVGWLRSIARVVHSTCMATSNGSEDARRECARALTEAQ